MFCLKFIIGKVLISASFDCDVVFADRCGGLSSSETVPLNFNECAENKRHPMSSSSARTCCSGRSEDNVS